ncbi:hypothetical protein AA11825_0978 [Acetobacter pomorum DSM 11825]|nr:hypothetical protein [Acetobacter pomorum]GBR48424.1 hypothetical protein AA11825_0978 [Acetobacter pomorum DSM 11825]
MSDGKASMGLKRRTGSIEEQDMEEAYLDELSDDEPSISSAEPKTDAHSAPESDLTETAPHAEHQSHEGPEESSEVDMLLPDPPEDLSSAVMDTPRVPSENTALDSAIVAPPVGDTANQPIQPLEDVPADGVLTENTQKEPDLIIGSSGMSWPSPPATQKVTGVSRSKKMAFDHEPIDVGPDQEHDDAAPTTQKIDSQGWPTPLASTQGLGTQPMPDGSQTIGVPTENTYAQEWPNPENISVQFYVPSPSGGMTSDLVSYIKNADGTYIIDPSEIDNDNVKTYISKGIITPRLGVRTPDGEYHVVVAGTKTADDFMKVQMEYITAGANSNFGPSPFLDPEYISPKQAPPSDRGRTSDHTQDTAYPFAGASAAPGSLNNGGLTSPLLTSQGEVRRKSPALNTPAGKFIAAIQYELDNQRTKTAQDIMRAERMRFMEVRHSPRQALTQKANGKLSLRGRLKLAAKAFTTPSSDPFPNRVENASRISSHTSKALSELSYGRRSVEPRLVDSIERYEKTTEKLSKAIGLLNTVITQDEKFNDYATTVARISSDMSRRTGSSFGPDEVILALDANDLSADIPDFIAENADVAEIATCISLLSEMQSQSTYEIVQGLKDLKKSGIDLRSSNRLSNAFQAFVSENKNVPDSIIPGTGNKLRDQTALLLREVGVDRTSNATSIAPHFETIQIDHPQVVEHGSNSPTP